MSATSVGEIGLDLVVNQKQFNKQMSGITGLAKKAGAALAGAFAVKKVIDFGKSCLDLGSDLQEVQNVVDVSFPQMSAQVDKFAKSAAGTFGLSETMAKRFTGTFGSMAKAFGFSEQAAYDMGTTLTGLAGDVASFYNISQDEAYTKLKSVFTGETESLKDLGVVMTQSALDAYALANGYGKTTAAMSEMEKVALRYSFVQSQLSAASGDFARTSGSWANQVRILKLQFDSFKATIGQGLINLFTPVIKIINVVLGKLSTLANAFKAFTELITGKKSESSGTAAPVEDLAGTAKIASEGLDTSTNTANGLSKATKGVGNAAKKAAKEMRALMGFEQINKLDVKNDPESAAPGDTGTNDGISGILGSPVDYGQLAQGETVLDKTNKKMSTLLKRCKELAAIFKKGFRIGFGDSEKKIDSINRSVKEIGKNLKEIFTDSAVVSAANKYLNAWAMRWGKFAGSATRIGLTFADNFLGEMDKYLAKSKNYIKKRIVSIFDVSTEIENLRGELYVACADIFDVFSSNDAKAITGDIIQIFADGFLGVSELAHKFVRDFLTVLVTPIIQNVDTISLTLENMLGRWRIVFDSIARIVTDTFDKINQIYDEHFKPFVNSVAQGISDILKVFLDAYNTYISPVLDYLADKCSTIWTEHVQPALDGILNLLGKIFDNLKALWETALVPFVEWIINTIMPVLSPIIAGIGELILDLSSVVWDVIKGITDILGGFLDFCTGVFKDDFGLCWKGIEQILEGFKTVSKSIFEFVKKYILTPFIEFVKGVFATDWSESFGTLGTVLDTFLASVRRIWGDIKNVFDGIITFVEGVFSGNWEQAWEGVKCIFGDVFDSMITLAKTPLNAVIDIINSLMNKLNYGLSAIEDAFSFNYDFTNPLTGTRHWGHYGLNLPRVPEIPHLAEGGYVPRNSPQLAMIGDNKRYGEIVAPENKLRQMAMEAAMAAGGGISRAELEAIINNAVMRIVTALSEMGFYIDGQLMAKALRMAMEELDYRENPVKII